MTQEHTTYTDALNTILTYVIYMLLLITVTYLAIFPQFSTKTYVQENMYDYIEEHGPVTINDVSNHTGMHPFITQHLLAQMSQQHKIRQYDTGIDIYTPPAPINPSQWQQQTVPEPTTQEPQ